MKLSELGRMLEKAAGVEGRELSPGERQAQLEKYRFRFVNIYQELEMSSRFVDTHRDVSQGGDGVQLHSHTFYEMIYCTAAVRSICWERSGTACATVTSCSFRPV